VSRAIRKFSQPASAIEVEKAGVRPGETADEAAHRIAIERLAADPGLLDEPADEGGQRALAAAGRGPAHRAADAHEPAMAALLRRAFLAGRRAIDRAALLAALGARDQAAAVAATAGAAAAVTAALGDLRGLLHSAAVAGNGGAAQRLRRGSFRSAAESKQKGRPYDIARAFDAANEDAAAWAEEHAGALLDDLEATTISDIAQAVAESMRGELSTREAYAQIAAAVGDDARAQTIARTEAMDAANEGQRQSWAEAVDAGLLPKDARRVWIAAEGPCPECEDLDGEAADMDGEYPAGGGDGPPLHPNCRCTEGLDL
jgi:hypothetical protein